MNKQRFVALLLWSDGGVRFRTQSPDFQRTVIASFAGSIDYTSASSAAVTFTIGKADAGISVTPYGVIYDSSAHTATGAATGVGGVSLTGLDLSGTTHTNAGTYASDSWTFTDRTGNYNNASGTVSDSITPASTSVAVTSSLNPSIVGQSVTFTATVSNASTTPVPTGTVTFTDTTTNTILASNVALDSSGKATYATSALTVGTHQISATYNTSDGNFQSPTEGSVGQSVTVNVTYSFSGFLAPVSLNRAFKQGSTIPLQWQLKDSSGKVVTSLSAITSLQVQASNGTLYNLFSNGTTNSTYASGGTVLRNEGSNYIYNFQTKGLSTGTYTILLTLKDGTVEKGQITLSTNGANASVVIEGAFSTGASAGGLLAGDMTVYVDNSNGEFTSDELARIEDAINGIEALVAPYGTNLVEVDSSVGTAATFVIDANGASAVGGYADGVLGCYNDAVGEITLIDGWNWYTGSDPTQIVAGQYDFQTVATHELGHALGLGHSINAGSVMYATLDTGVANRTLTTQDLNLADPDGGVDGLHAALPAGNGTANGQGMAAPSNTSVPLGELTLPAQSGNLLSAMDQIFADLGRLLSDARSVYQSGLSPATGPVLVADLASLLTDMSNVYQSARSSVPALWLNADAQAQQRLDALLSLEAGALGLSKNTLLHDLLFASMSSPNG